MKQVNTIKTLLLTAILGAASAVNGQTINYPLAYGPHELTGSTTLSTSNWYKDYLGVRVEVTAPAAIAGNYNYQTTNDGNPATTTNWGGVVTEPLVNVPIFMDSTSDSFGSTDFSAAAVATIQSTTPHMIVVIWRGPEGTGAIDFGCKAQHALDAGASACVIINEYAGQPPVGMAASTTCTAVSSSNLPIFMIGNLDGINVSGQYRSGVPVTMTITPWGAGLTNDLGFVPNGGAFWHDFSIPSNQISTNVALNQLDGAFIGNFGTSAATNVKLKGNLSFTPTGGSTTLMHSDSVTFTASTPQATYPFAAVDSIIAMFCGTEYTLPGTGTGRYDLTYTVSSDLVDQDPADNTLTYSFYATDSIYSKGRYDFTTNQPVVGESESFGGGDEFIWGPMYFVGPTAGTAVQTIQYSLAQNSTNTPPTTVILTDNQDGNLVYVYQWIDGANGQPADSLVENGELELVSCSLYTFDNLNDTSGALLQLHTGALNNFICDAGGQNPTTLYLNPNSWYYVAVDVPASTFLGVDDQLNPFPRIYGREYTSGLLDYSSIVLTDTNLSANPALLNFPVPGAQSNVLDVDSFQFHELAGIIPSVAMIVNNHPDTVGVGVKNITPSSINLSVYPNPTSDYLNISVNMSQPAKTVVYEVTDGLGRFVSKVAHNNVQKEVYTISTANLAPGNYHIAVIANGHVQVLPFTVLK